MPRTPDGKEKLLPGSRPASPSPGPEPAGATSAAGSGWSGAAEPAAADADAGGAAGLLQRVRGVLRQLSHELSREDGDSDEDEGGAAEGSSLAAAALRESRSAFAAGGGASPHPNFPMVRPDVGEVDVVPVVSETRGRPTPRDVWKYSTCACVAACTICVCVPVLIIVALVVVYEEQGQAGLDEAVGASACSSLPLVQQLVNSTCNSCKHGGDRAYDGECDENGACNVGTDRFDCLVQVANRQALYQAWDATATIDSFDGPVVSTLVATSVVIFLATVLVGVPLCCGFCCGIACPGLDADKLPVLSDYLFDLTRSKALAIVELVSLFLVIFVVDPFYEFSLCQDTFTINPNTVAIGYGAWNGTWNGTWPGVDELPPQAAIFRRDPNTINAVLQLLLATRFFCANAANSRWHTIGRNLGGLAMVCGLFLSIWCLVFLADDLSYCKYPSDMGLETGQTYCTVYSEEHFPDGLDTAAVGQDCLLQNRTGWNHVLVSATQTVLQAETVVVESSDPILATATAENIAVEMMPEYSRTFFDSIYQAANTIKSFPTSNV